ncbi:aldehyde dehydrogenase (NADP(+)) [Allorhodopirellula heiligendammensis]|uniref:NADP-dependent fatty aldehyde dehydrogenase n=1 Tax=Allorhodopirellula heiligendammensis TaxID=2714739 RepID=A0A5C6BVY9_9BACT|nr:aldehyde dehydrogenase (NADP(+)) [Allorhodopirellula heiligendammensis]TWU16443.1 NADP-dependent fatty aldehyde dehydrogenase [Allorhodopirellula heiligendammensis]
MIEKPNDTDLIYAFNPSTGQRVSPGFSEASEHEINTAADDATGAAAWLADCPPVQRGDLLERVAKLLAERKQEIVDRCVLETGYLPERVIGEFQRAHGQLRLFAELARQSWWDQRQIDPANPNRSPAPGITLPRPEMRRRLVPVGPVAVFGACNFPLAISVLGNDFVAAIAVGCPVIVKSHPSHPGTCELLGRVATDAVRELDFPIGTFALLHCRRPETSRRLVEHPAIAAVGFTGSPGGGRALANAVLNRPQPIPIFAELGSTNPVFLATRAIENRGQSIATGFAESLRFGNGHMCTKPGVLVMLDRQSGPFIERVVRLMSQQRPLPLLSGSIADAFDQSIARFHAAPDVHTLFDGGRGGPEDGPWHRGPQWFAIDSATAIGNQQLRQDGLLHCETFGPVSLLVRCHDEQEMLAVAQQFTGSLTTTLHADSGDADFTSRWLPIAEQFAGRIVYNGWPTGMEIGPATQHGGPYPASLDGNSTSVGYASLRRFLRPVCYQNWPSDQLTATGDWSHATGPIS